MNWFKRFIEKIIRDLFDDDQNDVVDKIARRAADKAKDLIEREVAEQVARE